MNLHDPTAIPTHTNSNIKYQIPTQVQIQPEPDSDTKSSPPPTHTQNNNKERKKKAAPLLALYLSTWETNHCVVQVPNPLDYAMVVKRIGNEMDMTTVDLEGVLPQTQIMVCAWVGIP